MQQKIEKQEELNNDSQVQENDSQEALKTPEQKKK